MTESGAPNEEDAIDLEGRELCPDGACIGLLGADGRCSECGRTREEAQAEKPAVHAGRDEPETGALDLGPPEDGAFEEDRQLCPDGACIGVIGPDGRCKVCGRSA